MVKPFVAWVLCLGMTYGYSGAPDDEIAAVEKAYATCKTYRDTATVTSESYAASGARVDDNQKPRQVKTAFQRGGAFRFEYRSPNRGRGRDPGKEFISVVWAQGEELKIWPEGRKTILKQDANDPHYALSVLTGVTEGTSTKIPIMLLPSVARELKPEPGFTPIPGATKPPKRGFATEYRDAVRLPDTDKKIGDTNCYLLQKKTTAINFDDGSEFQVTTTFWIDMNSHLIRRAQTEMAFKDGTRDLTRIDYSPEIDIELDARELEFNPPN